VPEQIMTKPCPFCAEQIQQEAVFCKHCRRELTAAGSAKSAGAAPKSSPIVKYGGGFLLACVALALVSGAFGPLGSNTTSDGRFVMPQSIGPGPVATKAEFDRLQEGITYEQAVQIIGAPGEVQSSSDLAGIKTVMYGWANANGSNMNAMFQNGALIQKAQFGLP